jgi:hypothetical protein
MSSSISFLSSLCWTSISWPSWNNLSQPRRPASVRAHFICFRRPASCLSSSLPIAQHRHYFTLSKVFPKLWCYQYGHKWNIRAEISFIIHRPHLLHHEARWRRSWLTCKCVHDALSIHLLGQNHFSIDIVSFSTF